MPTGFHEFYDPNDHFGGDSNGVINWLTERRQSEPVVVQTQSGERELNVREQIAVELGQLCLLNSENVADWTHLGLDEDALREMVGIAEFGVSQMVRCVKKTVELIRENPKIKERIHLLDKQDLGEGAEILLAGAVVSAMAHEGQERLNGAPFYTHPVSVSHILSIGFRDLPRWKDKVDMRWLRLLQYRALNHDSLEDALPDKDRVGCSFLQTTRLIASPLLHKTLLESCGVDSQEAQKAADDIVVLTKSVGIDGRMKNEKYMERFIGRVEPALVKLADITHNLYIDPKERPIYDREKRQKWSDKRKTYGSSIKKLERNIVNAEDCTKEMAFVAARISAIRKNRLVVVRKNRLLSQLDDTMVRDAYYRAVAA